MWENKKAFKRIALLLVFTVIISSGLPVREVAMAVEIDKYKKSYKQEYIQEKNESTTQIGTFEEDLSKYYEKVKESTEKEDLKSLKENIKGLREALKTKKKQVLDELKKNEETIKKLKIPSAQKRQEKFKEEIDKKLLEFEEILKEVENLSDTLKETKGKDYEELKEKIEEIEKSIMPEKPHNILGNNLPHDNIAIDPPAPRTSSGITPRYMMENTPENKNISVEDLSTENLIETEETKLSDEMKELVDSFHTPVQIYEYVRNSIDFEPYYGSRKGSIGTFNQKSGNDYDQASLLIAMLRYKGYPTRYVKGTIEIPIEKAKGWTGAETPKAANKILGSLGTPTVGLTSQGNIIATQKEHIWVETYVPYENYRGAGKMKGQKIWVPLDPSFKQYEKIEGIEIDSVTGTSQQQIMDEFKFDFEESSGDNISSNIEIEKIYNLFDNSTQKIEDYTKTNNLEDIDIRETIGGKKIIPEKLKILPLTLPYKTVTVLSEMSSISEASKEKIGFSIRGNNRFNSNFTGENDFDIKLNAIELYGKKITLSWTAASEEDKEIINSYGGIFKTPAYMIQLKPQLKVDGQVLVEGKGVELGNIQEFTISMNHVGKTARDISNPVTVGGFYSVSLNYGQIDTKELEGIKDKILSIQDAKSEDMYTDEAMGEVLNSIGKIYFGQLDGLNTMLANIYKVSSVRQISAGMTGYEPNVGYMFSTPVEVTEGSFFIDIDYSVSGVVSLENKKQNEISYMIQKGLLSSAMEHGIYEQIFNVPSLSTVKILSEANSRGVPLHTLSKDNIEDIKKINVSSSIEADIINAVNSDKIVIVAQEKITYYNWVGSGYIIIDPETGGAGYMISGGSAGGSTGFDLGVAIAGTTALGFAIADVALATIGLMGAIQGASLFAGVGYGAFFMLSSVAFISTMTSVLMYIETGDYKYANELMLEAFLNVALFGAGKILERLLPTKGNLFNTAKEMLGEVAEIEVKYGKEIAEYAARHGDDAIKIIKKHGDDAVRIITKHGDEGLAVIVKYKDDVFKLIAEHGDEVVETIIKYSDDAVDAMKKGIDPELIKKLDDLGIKPSEFKVKGINSKEAAEGMIEKLEGMGKLIDDIIFEGADEATKVLRRQAYNEFVTATRGIYESTEESANTFMRILKEEDPWSIGFNKEAAKTTLKPGQRIEMAISSDQATDMPGGFGTFDEITDINYVRNQLAVKSEWKFDIDRVVVYEVVDELHVISGTVGPQIDEALGKYLSGGGHQVEMLVSPSDRMKYLKIIEVKNIN